MNSVLIGMFDSEEAAKKASNALHMAGIAPATVAMAGAATVAQPADQEEGGIMHFFRTMFGDDDQARNDNHGVYQEAFRRGSFGVSATTTSQHEADKAEKILNDCGAVDIDEQSRQWQQDGWTGQPLARVTSGATDHVDAIGSGKLQEVEEERMVGKRTVARSSVRIFSRMTEVPVEETVRDNFKQAKVEVGQLDPKVAPALIPKNQA